MNERESKHLLCSAEDALPGCIGAVMFVFMMDYLVWLETQTKALNYLTVSPVNWGLQ